MALYEDMLSYPPPKSIPPSDHQAYRDVVQQKATILGWRMRDTMRLGGGPTQWVGSVTQRLTESVMQHGIRWCPIVIR